MNTSPIATRFNQSNPCPVCGSGTKSCSATEDDLHFCRGEPLAGWKLVKKEPSDAGFKSYRLATDTTHLRNGGRRNPRPVLRSKQEAAPKPPKDWAAEVARYAKTITPEHREWLADHLELPVSALDALPDLGWCSLAKWWSFPEVDGAGNVVGVNRRFLSGKKKRVKGSGSGLTVPAGWRDRAGPLLLVEGASDVLAASLCGLPAVGRPNNVGGVELLAELLRDWPADRPIIVVGENDQKDEAEKPVTAGEGEAEPGGPWPGRDGAVSTAKRLAKALSRPVAWSLPPDGTKDVRAWVSEAVNAGATDYAALGGEIAAHLTENATTTGANDSPGEPTEATVDDTSSGDTDTQPDHPRAIRDNGEPVLSDPAELDRVAAMEVDDPEGFAAFRAAFRKRGGSVRDLDKAIKSRVTALRQRRQEDRRREQEAAGDTGAAPPNPYYVRNNVTFRLVQTKDGEAEVPLANFTANIVAVVTRDDGAECRKFFSVEGRAATGRVLPATEVPTAEFNKMEWVAGAWGNDAVIYAGSKTREDFRTATQLLSGRPVEQYKFGHTGWRPFGAEWRFLHAGGSIGAGEDSANVTVDLAGPLAKYVLPEPPAGRDLVDAVRSLLLPFSRTDPLAPDAVLVPLFGTAFRAVLGGTIDFGVFLWGPTGSYKSELATLPQQGFGAAFDSRSLPGNWSSTVNALELAAFATKDCVYVCDDFCPNGAADPAKLHAMADRLLRAAGNGAGRGRLNADLTIRPERAPRGLILCTGEDLPRGHSLLARVPVVPLKPGDVNTDVLTRCQRDAAAGRYAAAIAAFVKSLAPGYAEVLAGLPAARAAERAAFATAAPHGRTPGAVGDLMLGWKHFLRFAREAEAISAEQEAAILARARAALLDLAGSQAEHLSAADPCVQFMSLVPSLLASKQAHLESLAGGQPDATETTGWALVASEWKGMGPRIGWIDSSFVYLLPEAAYTETQRAATAQKQPLHMSPRTLWARLHEKRLLLTGEVRGGKVRHTSRVTPTGGHRVEVLKFPRAAIWPGDEGQ